MPITLKKKIKKRRDMGNALTMLAIKLGVVGVVALFDIGASIFLLHSGSGWVKLSSKCLPFPPHFKLLVLQKFGIV